MKTVQFRPFKRSFRHK